MRNLFLAGLALAFVSGCPQNRPPAPPPGTAAPVPNPLPDPTPTPVGGEQVPVGSACTTDTDCEGNASCEGFGCGPGEGICVAKERRCTRDYIERCTCDGRTVGGSSNCLNGRIASKGPCGAEPTSKVADGKACTGNTDCQSGICEGQGCGDLGGTCMPKGRACTMDIRLYCSCSDQTFQGSGSCPGQRVKYQGECKG